MAYFILNNVKLVISKGYPIYENIVENWKLGSQPGQSNIYFKPFIFSFGIKSMLPISKLKISQTSTEGGLMVFPLRTR